MSGIGLIGSSSTGKTTLAKAVSELTGIPFISSQVRAAYSMHKEDPELGCAFDQRRRVQEKMLELAEADYQNVKSLFISDRTPMDFAAHVVAEALAWNLTPEQTQWVLDYTKRCYSLTNWHFSSIILIQPAFKIVAEPGRTTSVAYQSHINFIMTGMVADPDNKLHCSKHFLKKSLVNLNKRVNTVIKIAQLSEITNMKQQSMSVVH